MRERQNKNSILEMSGGVITGKVRRFVMKRILSLLMICAILFSLIACNSDIKSGKNEFSENEETNASTEEKIEQKIPLNEYERAVWYGFLPEELKGAEPDSTTVTWKQYCTMLRYMIELYDESKLDEWDRLTVDVKDEPMLRDGALLCLLFAAKTSDFLVYNRGYDPRFEATNLDNAAWDYPILGWDTPVKILDEEDNNHLGISVRFCARRVSCITLEPLLNDIDGDGDLHVNDELALRDAMISVTRLYESNEEVALKTAEKLFELVKDNEDIKEIIEQAEIKKQEILNSETSIVKSDTYIPGETYTGTAYYISNSGNDESDGKSPETAWETIERLASVKFERGDIIFFERGGVWREVQMPDSIRHTEGLTLSAYGEGEKPKLWGSPENGTGAEKWSLHYEGENGEKIWKFYKEMTDCPVIVLDGQETFKRDLAYWDGSQYLCIEDFTIPYLIETHMKDGELFVELPYIQSPVDENDTSSSDKLGRSFDVDANNNPLTSDLFVRCDEGNPGELYKDVEFVAKYAAFDGMANYTTLDNLSFGYSTDTIASGYYEGVSSDYVTIQNCEVSWNGGALKWFGVKQNAASFGHAELCGGGINVNGSYETVQNCYVHHTFQEGICLETFSGDPEPCEGTIIRDNVIEYCLFGLGAANWEEDENSKHILKDICIENNYSLYSGFESFYNYPPLVKSEEYGEIHWSTMIGYVMIDAGAFSASRGGENYNITGNTFAFSVSQLVQHSEMEQPSPVNYEGNVYAVLPGFAYSSKINNDFGVLDVERDATNAIKSMLGDDKAVIIDFE